MYGKNGKKDLLKKLSAYNQAALYSPWIVLIDLDHDADCAPDFKEKYLPNQAANMCFRVAVPEVESWLLADRDRVAQFLGVSVSQIPMEVDNLFDPKQTLITLANQSSRSKLKKDLTPKPGSGRHVGPAYASRIIEFIKDEQFGWRPETAALVSDSLQRCIKSIKQLLDV